MLSLSSTTLNEVFDKLKSQSDAIIESQKNFLGVLGQVDAAVSSINKQFGLGVELSFELSNTFVAVRDDIIKLGGSFEDITKTQSEFSSALGRNAILQEDQFKKLFAVSQVTGQNVKDVVTGFKDAGFSAYKSSEEMQKVVDTARSIGVSAQDVSAKVIKNMSTLNTFNFQGGVEGLAKMAAQATSLRIDMGQTLKFAEGLFQPEKAIEMAAAFQRLGVAQSDLLDPLKLMDLSMNDPTELQNQIAQMTQQFVHLNDAGRFEILPGAKLQLMEISKAMGIPYDQLTKMALGGAELETKLSKIKFPDFATKEQRELIANLTEIGEGGEMKIKVGADELNIQDALKEGQITEEDFNELIKASKPKAIEDLAVEQLDVTKKLLKTQELLSDRIPLAFAGSRAGALAVGTFKEGSKMADEIVTSLTPIKSGAKLIDVAATGAADAFKKLTQGDMKGFSESLTKTGKQIENDIGFKMSEMVEKLQKQVNNFSNLDMDKISKGLREGTTAKDLLKETPTSPIKTKDAIINNTEIQTLPEDTILVGTGLEFLKEFIKPGAEPPIIQNITNALGFKPEDLSNIARTISENKTTVTSPSTPSEITVNFKMTLDVTGTNSSQIDTAKLMTVLNDPAIREQIVQVTKEAVTNNGQTKEYK